jgi:CubicO group peptidase (beta-lactamase class C family)
MAHTLALALHYNWRAGGEVLTSEDSRRLLAVSRRNLGPLSNTDRVFAPYNSHFIEVHRNGAMGHGGYGGQVWYANHKTGVVIVQMATSDTPSASLPPQVNQARTEILKNIDAFLSQ